MIRFRLLVGILAVSVAAALSLPLFTTRVLHPAFDSLLTRLAEEDSVRLATSMAGVLSPGDEPFRKETFLPRYGDALESFRRDANLVKVKLFTAGGEIVYSTDREEIGEVNRWSYFRETVARGIPYSKVIHSRTNTLEGQLMATDVVETYVPILRGGRFVGAFEIYYDISASKARMDALVRRSTLAVLAVALGLLAAVVLSTGSAWRTLRERNRIEESLRESERKYRDLYDNAPDMYLSLDRDGIVTDCNETGARMLGSAKERVVGRPYREFLSERSRRDFEEDLPVLLGKETHLLMEQEYVRRDGAVFPAGVSAFSEFDRDGRFLRIKAIGRDIREQKRMEEALRELAETDPLTGTFNRRTISRFLEAETDRARRYRRPFSLVLFDLDRFKEVNDSFGHEAGDSVLLATVSVVREKLRKSDLLGRYGGDEFLILSPEMNREGVRILAEKIRRIVESHRYGRVDRMTVSVGAGLLGEAEDGVSLLRRVDEALFVAKRSGRNRVEFAG